MRLAPCADVARRPRLRWAEDVRGWSWIGDALVASPIVVYAIVMAAAAASPSASVLLFFSVPILYFLLITIRREGRATRAQADDFS